MEQQQVMLPVKNVRVAHTAKIAGGNLIAWRGAQKLDLGLNIPETETTPKGILSLHANGVVAFERRELDCLDLGKPIFVWTPGTHDCFTGQGFQLLAGQLAVQGDSVLIAGHDVSCVPRTLFTWDVHTGHRTHLQPGATALFPEWKLGVKGLNDGFVELLDFPRGRSFFR